MKRIALAFVALATIAIYSPAHAFSLNTGGGIGARFGKTRIEHSFGGVFNHKRVGFETRTIITDDTGFGIGHSRGLILKR